MVERRCSGRNPSLVQAGEESRGSCASQSNGCCLHPAMVEQFLAVGAAQAVQQLTFIRGEISRVYGGQHQPEPAAPEHAAGGEEKEAWEGDWDKEKAASGWYEGATVDPAVDLAWCQNANGGSLGERIPSTPRNGKRPLSGREKTTWKVTDKRDEEWKEGDCGQKEKSKKNSQGKDPKTFEINCQGEDPRTFEGNSQAKDASTLKGRGHQAKRWRVQEKRKEEKWKKKKKKEKEEGKALKKKMVEKVQGKHRKSVYFEEKRGCEGKGK